MFFPLSKVSPSFCNLSSHQRSKNPNLRERERTSTMAKNYQERYDQNVIIKNTMLVLPRSSHAPSQQQPNCCSVLELSNLDRKCPALMYLVLFYRKPTPSPHKHLSFFKELKEGLEETLSAWYPAAGRLTLDPESGRLDAISGNNYGALWAEAVTKVHIEELGDLSHAHHFLDKLVVRPPIISDDGSSFSQLPLVVAQVTEFGCGGYAVGVGTNHALFDGTANFNFISAWASNTAAHREGRQPELVEPVHERGRLLIDHGQTHKNSTSRTKLAQIMPTGVLAFDHLYQLIKQALSLQELERKLGVYKISNGGEEEEFVLRTFTIIKEMVEELKSKVTSSSCTSFEVVAAHLWKARTRAIQVPKERTVCLQFSVDTRNRLSPPLPKSFTGNAYVLSSISSTCGDLLQETLTSIVHKIKEAKNAVNDDYVNAYLLALEAPQFTLPALPELTVVSDWSHTPYHKVNFGIGDAVCAVPLAAPLREVVYFMRSSREVGGIDVRIGLMRKHLDRFCNYFMEMM